MILLNDFVQVSHGPTTAAAEFAGPLECCECLRGPESMRVGVDQWIRRMEDKRTEAFLSASPERDTAQHELLSTAHHKAGRRATASKNNPELTASFLAEVNHQVFRRTCTTHMQDLGSLKDIQAHLRHSTPAMTRYIQQIPRAFAKPRNHWMGSSKWFRPAPNTF